MRRVAFLVAYTALFLALPWLPRWGATVGPLVGVSLAVACALLASGTISALAIAAGGASALGAGLLFPVAPVFAGGVLLPLLYGERLLRVRSRRAGLAHVAATVFAGALSGGIASSYAGSEPAVRGVAAALCAVLCAVPLLIEADDPVAHLLAEIAADLPRDRPEAMGSILATAAVLRQHTQEVPLDRKARREVEKTWRALVSLANARARLSRTAHGPGTVAEGVVAMVDGKLRHHVDMLRRTYDATDTARAASVGLDDAALRGISTRAESLEVVSRAMTELEEST